MKKIISWFDARTKREQLFLMIGAGLVTVYFIYSVLWAPLQQRVIHSKQESKDAETLLAWVKESEQELFNHRSMKREKLTPKQLLQQVSKAGFTAFVIHVAQPHPGQVSFTLKNVPFDKYIAWLENVSRRYEIKIARIEAHRGEVYGTVNVSTAIVCEKSL